MYRLVLPQPYPEMLFYTAGNSYRGDSELVKELRINGSRVLILKQDIYINPYLSWLREPHER